MIVLTSYRYDMHFEFITFTAMSISVVVMVVVNCNYPVMDYLL